MNIAKLAGGLAIGAGALVFSASAALAVEAEATGSVNVRSGPGTSYAVLGQLRSGDRVDISGRSGGWCQLSGPDGWVSCRYLVASDDPIYYDDEDDYYRGRHYSRPDVSISFGFGSFDRRHRHPGPHHDHHDGGMWNSGWGWMY